MPKALVVVIAIVIGLIGALAGLGIGLFVTLVRQGVINLAWTEANIEASRDRASGIIAALGEYHAAHGAYPERLDALTPEYLAELPTPVAGVDEWTYGATDGGDQFILQFSANEQDNPTSWYESRHGGWFLQDREHVSAE